MILWRFAVARSPPSNATIIAIDLENAVGQYIVYQDVLKRIEPERILYLAIDVDTFHGIFSEPIGELLLENKRLNLVIFNKDEEVILKWIQSLNINK